MIKTTQWLAGFVVLVFATPALAATESSNGKAVWIALGAAFLGAFTAIGAGLVAAQAKKRKSSDEE